MISNKHSLLHKINSTENKSTPGKNYKFFILALGCLSTMIVMAIPHVSMSVLMPDISEDLNLTIAQVGIIWGIGSIPAMFSGLFAGALGDKLGLKRIAIIACFLMGITLVLQGLASNFITMMLTIVLAGLFRPLLLNNMIKVIGIWFPKHEMGLANGIFSVSMGIGFLTGSMVSGNILMPFLGSWRYVFMVFGACAWLLILPWLFSREHSSQNQAEEPQETPKSQSIFAGLLHVVKIRDLWFMGLASLCFSGSIYALLGYLALYLEKLGWQSAVADSAISTFYIVSLASVIPFSFLSEKTGKGKRLLIIFICVALLGFGILYFADSTLIWAGIILIGMVRDAYMSISTTMMLKVKGLNFEYLGSASSFRMILTCFGFFLAPSIGNKLAEISPNTPFIFWLILASIGIIFLSLISSPEPETS